MCLASIKLCHLRTQECLNGGNCVVSLSYLPTQQLLTKRTLDLYILQLEARQSCRAMLILSWEFCRPVDTKTCMQIVHTRHRDSSLLATPSKATHKKPWFMSDMVLCVHSRQKIYSLRRREVRGWMLFTGDDSKHA